MKPSSSGPTDFGPKTFTRPSHTRTGLGQVLQVRGNPITWLFSCAGDCIPVPTRHRGEQGNPVNRMAQVSGDFLGFQPPLYQRGIATLPRGFEAAQATAQEVSEGLPSSADTTPVQREGSQCPPGFLQVTIGNRKVCKARFGR